MSVACLNLRYTVKIHAQMKDEKRDNITPLVLSELSPEDELGEEEEEEEGEISFGEEEGRESEMEGVNVPIRYRKRKSGKEGWGRGGGKHDNADT